MPSANMWHSISYKERMPTSPKHIFLDTINQNAFFANRVYDINRLIDSLT